MKGSIFRYIFILLTSLGTLVPIAHNLEHHHDHSDYNDCQECVLFENTDYESKSSKLFLSNNNWNIFISKYISFIQSSIDQKYLSRAPPLS